MNRGEDLRWVGSRWPLTHAYMIHVGAMNINLCAFMIGIGYHVAKVLAQLGGRVILACRSEERAIQVGPNIDTSTVARPGPSRVGESSTSWAKLRRKK